MSQFLKAKIIDPITGLPSIITFADQTYIDQQLQLALAGKVTSITGTANQVIVTGTTTPVLSLSNTLILPGTLTVTGDLTVNSTGYLKMAVGTTLQRPTLPVVGMTRFNTSLGQFEIYNGTSWIGLGGGSGTVTSIGITGSTGLSVSGSPITLNGTISLTLSTELQGLSSLNLTGLTTRTAIGTYTSRSISAGNGITVNNGDGVSGNPTIGISNTGITSGTYTYPSSLTVNAQGQLTSITSGSTPITSLTLTGAVIGSGSNNISTSLNMTQNMNGLSLGVNWSNSGSFAEYSINHYLQDSTPPPQFVETIQAGTYAANTYRWWNLIFQPGLSSIPTGNFQIDFVHNVIGRKTPFKVTSIGSGFTIYLSATLDMGSNPINNLPLPTLSAQPATKGYADSLVQNIPVSSLANYPSNSTKYLRGDGIWAVPPGGSSSGASAIIGDIKQSIKTTDHNGWLIWQKNRVLSRITYAALWSEVVASNLVAKGIFGNGDGSTTFTMGDIEGRHLGIAGLGTGLTARAAGDKIGNEVITDVPNHNHIMNHTHNATLSTNTHTHNAYDHTHSMDHDHPSFNTTSNDHSHNLVFFDISNNNSSNVLDTVVYQYTNQSSGGYSDYSSSGGASPFEIMYTVGLRGKTSTNSHSHTVNVPAFSGSTGTNTQAIFNGVDTMSSVSHTHNCSIGLPSVQSTEYTGNSSVNVMNPSVFLNLFIYTGVV